MNIVTHEKFIEWQAPPVEAPPIHVKGWVDDLIKNGDKWCQNQEGTRMMQQDIRMLLGIDQNNSMKTNMLEPDIRTFVETISDLKQIATLGTKAGQFKKYAACQNRVLEHTYWESEYVRNVRRALQYAMFGSGFLWTRFGRDQAGWGKAMNRFEALGPLEVLPEQLPHNNDLSGAYANSIVIPMSVWEAHARFPEFAEYLKPVARYDWHKYSANGAARLDYWDRNRFGNSWQWEDRYIELRMSWIRDLRRNETGKTLQMGVPGSSWGYTVPSYGSLIVATDMDGTPMSRKANDEDSLVYPQLRLIITCPSCPVPLYDDTAYDWHGQMPIVQYDVNDYPFAARGYSMIRKAASVERNQRARAAEINETLSVRKDPPTGYDFTSGVSRTQLEAIDLRKSQGIRIGLKGKPKESVVSILPEEIVVDSEDWKGQEWLNSLRKGILGLSDIESLRDLKMNLSETSLEKMVTNLGPMAKGMAMVEWRAASQLAPMLAANNAQYYTVSELIAMVGPEAIADEVYDTDPTSLVPDHLPGEDQKSMSRYNKRQRWQWLNKRIGVISTPMQLLDITAMQEKMMDMFLYGKQAPLPQAYYMKKFGVHNYDQLHEEWKQEQQQDAEWKLKLQADLAKKAQELGFQPPEQGGPGQGKGGGRPNSNKKPPKESVKGKEDGNVRPVNKTS